MKKIESKKEVKNVNPVKVTVEDVLVALEDLIKHVEELKKEVRERHITIINQPSCESCLPIVNTAIDEDAELLKTTSVISDDSEVSL